MTTDTVLSSDERDKFVGDLTDYGTEFVAPLYAVVESIEQAVLQSTEVQRLREDSEKYQILIMALPKIIDDKVREALEEAINLSSMYGATIELDAAIRALIPQHDNE